ncbi:hypothetical protein ACPC54_19505 [Kitasatospora sp. NPDC094028]
MTTHQTGPQPGEPASRSDLYRESVPPAEAAGHLNKLSAQAFARRDAARNELRTLLADPDADVGDVNALLLAQEQARLWRRVRAHAVGHPEMAAQAASPVFDPVDGHLIAAVRELRARLSVFQVCDSGEWEEREAARLFLVFTDFLDRHPSAG